MSIYGENGEVVFETETENEVEDLRSMLGNFLLMAAVLGMGLIVLAMLWKACYAEPEKNKTPDPSTPHPQAVYAHEIQPGFVVLQSQDGQFFRVLQEYSEAKWTSRHDDRDRLQRSNSNSTWRPIEEVESAVYTPQYTSAHFQTQPSAPLPYNVATPSSPLLRDSAILDPELINFQHAGTPMSPPPYYQEK